MTDYLDLNVTTDAPTLIEAGVDTIRTLADDTSWTPSPIEEWLIAAVARIGVEIAILSGRVPIAIFTYFGQAVLRIAALAGAPAVGSIVFHLNGTTGTRTVSAGAYIVVDGFGFVTDADAVANNGDSTSTTTITALTEGTDANGLLGSTVDISSPSYLFIDSVALTGTTSDGADTEDPADYANRLADELPTLSAKAITRSDFEALARRRTIVGRALALRSYDPSTPLVAAPGHVTVIVQDTDGADIAAPVLADISDDLEDDDERIPNIVVHVINGTRTPVDVAFTGTARDGFDPSTVQAAGIAAIQAFLANNKWGNGDGTDPNQWIEELQLRRNDLIGVLYAPEIGMRHVVSLTLGAVQAVTASASTDQITLTAHGFASGDPVTLTNLTGGAGLVAGTTYYVRDVATNTFRLAATVGGTAIDITTNLTAGSVHHLSTGDVTLAGPGALPVATLITGAVT